MRTQEHGLSRNRVHHQSAQSPYIGMNATGAQSRRPLFQTAARVEGGGGVVKQRILTYRCSPRDTGYTVTGQTSAEHCLEFAQWAIECCKG